MAHDVLVAETDHRDAVHSLESARDFGVRDPRVIKHWAMVDALLTPGFFAMPSVVTHFQQAFGEADTKARDVLQLIKVTLFENGRSSEVWW